MTGMGDEFREVPLPERDSDPPRRSEAASLAEGYTTQKVADAGEPRGDTLFDPDTDNAPAEGSDPPTDAGEISLHGEAERLEYEDRADSQQKQLVSIEAFGEEQIQQGAELRRAAAEITSSAEAAEQLQFAQRLIRDLGASLAAARPSADGYATTRRELAVTALRGLDLPTQVADGSDEAGLGRDVQTTIQSLVEQLTDYDPQDPTEAFSLLGHLDDQIRTLLVEQGDSPRSDEWLAMVTSILRAIGRLVTATGTALLVAGGSLLSIERRPAAADEIQAVAALIIGASCGLVQRDLPALWQQPDASRHLNAAGERLQDRMADLQAEATQTANQEPPGAASAIASYVFAVEYAAYYAGSLAAAAEGWPQSQGYQEEIIHILNICDEVYKNRMSTNSQLTAALDDSRRTLDRFRVPVGLRLRQEAQLGLTGRLREKAMQAGHLWPPINS
jgi:hypothetical protein